ncbi:hypothetical protein A5757_13470 [Mycobacterium sp. 852013-51886_SCH5428379]|uniref:hypothetical protein n=1 Tax=Mycobacterium sp. 852013-51886_SCH5428379 TaxID=1834111 RepID=UPI0007FC41CB|nr:hypothetical protein [Mycobacterium sp. 852013-51886_SCH5428379]OBB59341.1 hypothetical protein A5757_13470 [Mycobacterium sp. 852013-51886_SCH5428379]
MLIIALVLAVIGLAALVTAVVTSNELIAWVCIGASVIGVVLLIVDALRERSRGADADSDTASGAEAKTEQFDADYPDDTDTDTVAEAGDANPFAAEEDPGDADAVPFDERHEDPREDEPAVGDRNTP